jgi:hypothetical protein
MKVYIDIHVLCVCILMNIHICIYIYTCIYIYRWGCELEGQG